MTCRVTWCIAGHRVSTTVEAPSTIDALLLVMRALNLRNGIVKVIAG